MTRGISSVVHRQAIEPQQAFRQAMAFQQQGLLREAERLYEIVLKADERHLAALYHLGLVRLQQGRFEEAAALFRRAVKIDRSSADAHHHLAFALTGSENTEEAIRHYKRAIALRPNFAEAHNNFGHALQRLGRLNDSIAVYEKALAISPAYAEARNNLGNALHLLGRSEEAIGQYEQALSIRPAYPEAHFNLGNALRALGRPEPAISHYGKALALRPDYADAHNGLGIVLHMLGRSEEAIAHYEKALAVMPSYAEACINLANALGTLGRQDESIAQYDKALAIRPDDVGALYSRGNTLARFGRHDEAVVSFEAALSIEPDHANSFNGVARSAGAACDWTRTTKLAEQIAARAAKGKWVDAVVWLGYCSDPAVQLACAKNFVRTAVPVLPPRLWEGKIWRNDKIRVAYLSTGFHRHPNAYLTAELFELHDRNRFEVLGISLGPDDHSDMRARLARAFDQFHDVQLKNDGDVAKLLNDMRVDIAIDRSGYATNARPGILASRPAPIQVNYLGFPGTLGNQVYDYVVGDTIVLPFDQQAFYTEKIVHLPECYQSNDSKRAIAAEIPTRQLAGLPAHAFVFCCFNNNYKITAPVFEIWMRLLRRVEGSVLWLLRSNAAAEARLCREAAARGIDPSRLVFAGRVELGEHLARHRLADLFLDTLPYNAHTTGSDALWAGLPLITCYGDCFPGRVAASLLEAVGLPELVAKSLEDYEELALRLATDPSLLGTFRNRLKQNRLTHPLFDADRYRRHIEAAYTTMWELWQRGESPRSFSVEPLPIGGRAGASREPSVPGVRSSVAISDASEREVDAVGAPDGGQNDPLYQYLLRKFIKYHGYAPNFYKPATFNEKLFHRMLFDRRDILTMFADKIAVREYVEQRLGGTQHLSTIFGVFDKPEALYDFRFPAGFVLKANHGSGWNYIHADTADLNLGQLIELSRRWLASNFADVQGEWCYKNIAPKLFCEEYLGNEAGVPADYRFFCFDGRVRFIQVDFDRFKVRKRNMYDPNWNLLDCRYKRYANKPDPGPPRNLDLMKSISEKLADGVDFVRVDLYDLRDRVVFGELTNYPSSGIGRFSPVAWDAKFGSYWRLATRGTEPGGH